MAFLLRNKIIIKVLYYYFEIVHLSFQLDVFAISFVIENESIRESLYDEIKDVIECLDSDLKTELAAIYFLSRPQVTELLKMILISWNTLLC